MGFPPAEVAAGLAEVFAAQGLEAAVELDGERRTFRLPGIVVTVEPLPSARATHALFQPRTLLVVDGEESRAEALKGAIRMKFLRVTG